MVFIGLRSWNVGGGAKGYLQRNASYQLNHEADRMNEILIVDDDPIVRNFLRRMLCIQGYFCTEAEHGQEAIEHLRTHRPCLIITDHQMPEMTGIQFIENISQQRDYSTIPVILLIRDDNHDLSERAKQLGVHTILDKPLDYRRISLAVESVLL